MNPERWQRIEALFHAATELPPVGRKKFLADECRGDKDLLREVTALLAHDDPDASFIETPALQALGADRPRPQQGRSDSDTLAPTLLSDTPPIAHRDGDDLPCGHVIKDHRILRKIGEGGMGDVYLAEDLRLGRRVALKLLPETLHPDGRTERRFLREARAASALNHPHIVTIYSVAEADGVSFIEMEYIEGESLRDRLDRGPIELPDVIKLGLEVCDAVAAAHAINIVHRDLKPGNILITPAGQTKIVDFGLAKIAGAAAAAGGATETQAAPVGLTSMSLSQVGSISGTAPYMSPEQTRGEHIDARSDIFSLGCVLYEAATGRRPFDGASVAEIIEQVRTLQPPRPSAIRPDLPRAFDAVIMRSLAKDKQQRYATVNDLAADLRRLKSHLAVRGFLRRIRVPAAVVGLAVIALLAWDQRRRHELDVAAQKREIARQQQELARSELPKLASLLQELRFFDAHDLYHRVSQHIPDDPALSVWKPWIIDVLSVTTDPPGADVYLRRYQRDAEGHFPDRQRIGRTPLENVEIARGDYVLQLENPGYEPVQRTLSSALDRFENGLWIPDAVRHVAVTRDASGNFGMLIDAQASIEIEARLFPIGTVPERMVQVPGGDYDLVAWDRPTDVPVLLDEFFIDECEVTNAEYRQFLDAGGYETRSFWKHPFVQHDPAGNETRELSWEEAMAVFRDPDRKGPASWPAHRAPAGREDHPVVNVCWYEAAAYAEFCGKQLPTIYQWEHAARGDVRDKRWTVYWFTRLPWGVADIDENLQDRANLLSAQERGGTTPVGRYPFGLSPYGCFDMCGNVAEWCLNARAGGFATTGASWHDGPNLFAAVGEFPGFYCADTLGFRCVLNSPAATGDQGGMPFPGRADEIPKFEPVSEEAYRLMRAHYDYDPPPLNPLDAQVIEEVETDAWHRLKISYIGAEGRHANADAPAQRRGLAYLWLPKSARPPYQVINYKPGGASYQGMFVPQETEVVCGPFLLTGRAVFVALVEGMRERELPGDWISPDEDTVAYREMMVADTVDQRRGLDYLATRDDIDMDRIACMGLSLGNHDLVVMAVEDRFHATILLSAGLDPSATGTIAEANPLNFAPYIDGPKLMIHGRYDEGQPLRTRGQPLYDLLREPKDLLVLDTGHFPPMHLWAPPALEFLDNVFGPVQGAAEPAGLVQGQP